MGNSSEYKERDQMMKMIITSMTVEGGSQQDTYVVKDDIEHMTIAVAIVQNNYYNYISAGADGVVASGSSF